jgi:hypothetical protein
MISVQSSTHSLQIATHGVGPQTMVSTSAYALPQNEQRRAARSNGAAPPSGSRLRSESSPIREMLAADRSLTVGLLRRPVSRFARSLFAQTSHADRVRRWPALPMQAPRVERRDSELRAGPGPPSLWRGGGKARRWVASCFRLAAGIGEATSAASGSGGERQSRRKCPLGDEAEAIRIGRCRSLTLASTRQRSQREPAGPRSAYASIRIARPRETAGNSWKQQPAVAARWLPAPRNPLTGIGDEGIPCA